MANANSDPHSMEMSHGDFAGDSYVQTDLVDGPDKLPLKPLKNEDGSDLEIEIIDDGDGDGGSDDSPPPRKPPAAAAAAQRKPDAAAATAADADADDDDDYSEKVRKRINKFRWKQGQLEDQLRQMAAELEAARSERAQRETENVSALESQLDAEEKRLAVERDRLKDALMNAMERGDAGKLYEIQEAIADNRVEIKRVAYNKQQLDGKKRANTSGQHSAPASQSPAASRTTQAPPVRPSQKAESWAAENSDWFGKDRVMTGAAYAIDTELKEEGFDPNSDDFFVELSRRMRSNFPHRFQAGKSGNGAGAVVAPAARNSAAAATARRTNGSGKQVIRLTRSQLAVCQRMGVPPAEYARFLNTTPE